MKDEKKKLGEGIPVHYYTFWDSIKVILLISLIGAFFLSVSRGFFDMFVADFIGALILLFFGRFILKVIGIIPNKFVNTSFSFICPKCKGKVWCTTPQLRMNCPNCKEKVGFHDDMIYEITEKNNKYFKTEQEKTNDILKDKLVSNQNNLSEIKELKELLDMGAITQEEFDEKKKELLK